MKASHQKHTRNIFLWSLGGFIIGASIPCANILPELFKRLDVASTGGNGESSVWGEPLFYTVIPGIPAGLIGALIASAAAIAFGRRAKSYS